MAIDSQTTISDHHGVKLHMNNSETQYLQNKTGLQPVSRPVELVYYSEGWGVGANCKVMLFGLKQNLNV